MADTTHAPGCHCGCHFRPFGFNEQHGRTSLAIQRARHDPRFAIRLMSTGPVDDDDLQALVTLARTLPAIMEGGGTALFIKLTTEGYERRSALTTDPHVSSTSPPWQQPVQGLANILLATDQIRNEFSSLLYDVYQQIRTSYSTVVDVIWADILSLVVPGRLGSARREAVARFLEECALKVPGLRVRMGEPKTLSLAMHCWVYSSRGDRQGISSLITILLGDTIGSKPEVVDSAVQFVGADMLASKFREWLTDPDLIDEELKQDFKAMERLLSRKRPFTSALMNAKTYEHVIAALGRQKEHGKDAKHVEVYTAGDVLLRHICRHADIVTVTRMIDFGLLDFVAEMMCLTAANGSTDIPLSLELLTHVPDCLKSDCDLPCTPEFLHVCHTALLRTYLPILSRLQSIQTAPGSDCVRVWTTFAKGIGLTSHAYRSEMDLARECANGICPKRGRPGGKAKTKLCSKCRRVRYCSTECQQIDWIFHKRQCYPAIGA